MTAVATLLAGALAPTPASAGSGVGGATVKAAKEPGVPAVPARYLTQKIGWKKCDFSDFSHDIYAGAPVVNCAKVVVPMDWQHPDVHPDIKIAVAYSKATGVSQGLLTANPGGPGQKGKSLTNDLALTKHKLFANYDLLGFDPRGFGDSQKVECTMTLGDLRKLPVVVDPRVRSTATHKAELKYAKAYAKACTVSELAQFVGTQQTVYDLDFLRQLLGDGQPGYDRLNYIGYSYGTWLGAWYADTYPTHTGRFLLDSNMDWVTSMYANQTFDSFSFERRRDKMFYPWVARHNSTFGLGKTAAKVAKRYEKIRAALGRSYDDGGYLTPAQADEIVLSGLYTDADFPYLANQIVDLEAMAAGSSSAATVRRVTAALRQAQGQPTQTYAALLSTARQRFSAADDDDDTTVTLDLGGDIVRCNDSAYPRDLNGVLARADDDAVRFPFLGYSNTVSMCSYWKYPAASRTIDLPGVPRMLMLQSEGDPATAYEGARAAHRATADHTRLVSVDNEGQHGLYTYELSSCADKIADTFLLTGALPAKDTVCTGIPLPQDKKVYKLVGPLDGKSFSI